MAGNVLFFQENIINMSENGLKNDNTPQSKNPLIQDKVFKETRSFVLDVVKTIIMSLAIVLPIKYFLIQPFFVSGASMEPNFHDGEYLIVDELKYRFNDVARGDVVVFKYPYSAKDYYIKRIIGLPGEKIAIRNGEVKIYNSSNPEGFVLNESFYLPFGLKTTGEKITVLGTDEYFVMGDNRIASYDSRSWGVLAKRYIVGRTWVRAWPPGKFNVFEGINY